MKTRPVTTEYVRNGLRGIRRGIALRAPSLVSSLVLALALTPSAEAKQQPAERELPDETEQLNEARVERERSQALFFEQLTRRLAAAPTPPPRPKTFQESLAENPAAAFSVVGAVIAALFTVFGVVMAACLTAVVGLITLYSNSRAAERARSEASFYEAMKLFGDKDSVTVRSSAAGVLAQMARLEFRKFSLNPKPLLNNIFAERKVRPHFDNSLKQLMMGLLLEEEIFALLQIRSALIELVTFNPDGTAEMIVNTNRRLLASIRRNLADFLVSNGATDADNIGEAIWAAAPAQAFEPLVFRHVASKDPKLFRENFNSARMKYRGMTAEEKETAVASAYKRLELVSYRLYLSVDIFSHALPLSPALRARRNSYTIFLVNASLTGAAISGANLRNALLLGASLVGADLRGAALQGAWLHGAKINEARLHGAVIDEASVLDKVEWWRANYYDEHGMVTGSDMLKRLIPGALLPDETAAIHQSVRDYMAGLAKPDTPTATT